MGEKQVFESIGKVAGRKSLSSDGDEATRMIAARVRLGFRGLLTDLRPEIWPHADSEVYQRVQTSFARMRFRLTAST